MWRFDAIYASYYYYIYFFSAGDVSQTMGVSFYFWGGGRFALGSLLREYSKESVEDGGRYEVPPFFVFYLNTYHE